MEEREALKRQIELLQNLINKHKRVHASASSSVDQSSSKPVSHSVSLPGHSRGEEGDRTTAATLSSGIAQQKKDGHVTKQPSLDITFQTSQAHVGGSFLKKSKFTWVKSQNVGGVEPRQGSSISIPTGKAVTVTPTSVLKAEVASGSSPSFTVSKRTPAKKLPRKLSPVTVAPKTSKYKWVSSSAGAQAKTSRKPLSPKALTLAQRALDKREATKKLRAPSTPSAKIKKATCSSLSSRYRWKAGGQGASGAATAVARRRSAFHWTSEKSSKGVKGGLLVSPPQRASVSSSSPGVFKLRSRMKIIRKSANSGGGSERGSSPSAVKYSPRGRIYTSTRTPIGVRRTPTRELVSFGRHKLRRLSPTLSRTSPASSSHCSPVSQRVFRTRYKIVTRLGSSATHTPQYNPALSWRAKRIQSARSFLQSRLRAPHDRHPSSTQHWRGSGMCWIGGSLYRVSANKLSRTALSNTPISRTGRSFSPHVSYMIPAWNRPSSTRHLASRAVQRSLAIIRHARQKKQQKQYCMYYNRFGKCNRGNSCPYIHDPDKVAVCTRFLRGTCKQADGTCPFSHKVAKEKMPVCSYFLKGICNNSDCPYSHVYVSRKAEVCEDFVKGYCPEGEKCKKKHTLVCPDFSKTGSCPRGTRCKLQHRQRPKRSTSNTSTTPAKRARTKEPSKSPRPRLSVIMPHGPQAAPGMPTAGPLELPSYISLSSSPEEADAPDTLQAETSQVKEKKLQIKPRL
ncbi:zinc finger CCCH domain-containing protein 3 [Lates japonicus]|uniref:Zinc finger CCCH domain-containing protein 3 n=1 Tax=Lates japonicus TaxID=270547 RepID=A0AAD3QYX8_LATJO|nr:zinc finger CCCH domain-containing protein 3 [Lates japonicus]